MANIKGQAKGTKHDIYIANTLAQRGENQTGYEVQLVMANDLKTPETADIQPGLVYKKYTSKATGEEKLWMNASYSEEQVNKMREAANTEGFEDNVKNGKGIQGVFRAEVFPSKDNKGLVVNTNTLETREQPLDHAKHLEITNEARELNNVKKAEASTAKETEADVDMDLPE